MIIPNGLDFMIFNLSMFLFPLG